MTFKISEVGIKSSDGIFMVDEGRLEWLDAQWSKPQLRAIHS